MNYAIIKTGGKQYKVSEGDVITIERVEVKPNEAIVFSEVLLHAQDGKSDFGQPFLAGFSVTGKVVDHIRGEKIRVAKFKAKARYRRVTGHRQELSRVQIEAIGKKTLKAATSEKVSDSATTKPKRTQKAAQDK